MQSSGNVVKMQDLAEAPLEALTFDHFPCRGMASASLLRRKYGYLAPEYAVDHLVIGAGVVVRGGRLIARSVHAR